MSDATTLGTLWIGILLCYVLVCAVLDLRFGRIPNTLTYGGLLFGMALSMFPLTVGPGMAMAGAAFGFVPALVLFAFGGMGGGDVKLLAAVGALVGWPLMVDVLFYSIVVGTAIAVGMTIWHGRVADLLGGLKYHILALVYPKLERWVPVKDVRVPFAVAVAGGTIWALFLPVMRVSEQLL